LELLKEFPNHMIGIVAYISHQIPMNIPLRHHILILLVLLVQQQTRFSHLSGGAMPEDA
jgi:hypothetical protein